MAGGAPDDRRPDWPTLASFQLSGHTRQQVDGIGGIGTDPPVGNFFDRQRVVVIPSNTPVALDDDEPGAFEDPEVLHDRAPIEIGETRAELARRAPVLLEQVEESSPAPIRQGLENALLSVHG